MTSSLSLILTLVPIFLIILIPILLVRRSIKKKKEKRLADFLSFCEQHQFRVDLIMERQDRLAALDKKSHQVAWQAVNEDQKKKPSFFKYKSPANIELEITTSNHKVQKIMLFPTQADHPKKQLEIIFYDTFHDNESDLKTYKEEALKWEECLNEKS